MIKFQLYEIDSVKINTEYYNSRVVEISTSAKKFKEQTKHYNKKDI